MVKTFDVWPAHAKSRISVRNPLDESLCFRAGFDSSVMDLGSIAGGLEVIEDWRGGRNSKDVCEKECDAERKSNVQHSDLRTLAVSWRRDFVKF